MPLERVQKLIAQAGICSRRDAEDLIQAGRVRINGAVAALGSKADPRRDKVMVDGRRIQAEELFYLVVHKPRNCVSTLDDPEGRPTVRDLVRHVPARLFPVGRLDFATSGVLLMTNDGDFAQGLLHPRMKVPKTYVVKLDGIVDDATLERWRGGIDLDDGRTLPAEVKRLRDERGKSWLEITLREGKNQQIRRMAAATGLAVMRLARLAFAGIETGDLRPGAWRPLSADEQRKLKKSYGVPRRVRAPKLSSKPKARVGGSPRGPRPSRRRASPPPKRR